MLKITTRTLLNKVKDQPKSVLTKALNKDSNSNSNSNNNSNTKNDGSSHILFNGGIVNRNYDRYEFSSNEKPIRTVTIKQREDIKKQKNEIEEKNRETKRAMVNYHIKKDPKKKEVYEKFYQDYRNKEIEQKIHVELSNRDNDRVYDEITLDPPTNQEEQLKLLLSQIKPDKYQIYSTNELEFMDNIIKNCLSQDEINEINKNEVIKSQFEKAKKLYIAGNFKDSFEIFNKLSTTGENGHGMSHVFLGNMYYVGNLMDGIDYNKAFYHFYKAATIFKIPVAFGMLGELIYKGLVTTNINGGSEMNKNQALSYSKVYFSLASQLGLKSSTEQLAYIFINGNQERNEIMDKNVNGSIQMLKRLALNHKDVNAITTIAALLLDDHPLISKDLWIFASKLGDSNAQTNLGRYYYNNPKNPDYNNALLLWTAAAKNNNVDAQFYLGGMYQSGLVVEKSIAKSLKLYELSAKGGNSNAQFLIGNAYLTGDGIEQNIDLGNRYIKESAKQNNPAAIDHLDSLKNKN